MGILKRLLSIVLIYIISWLLATAVYGAFSLSLKILGYTLQGPVMLSHIGAPIVFFTSFVLFAWLIFRNRGARQTMGPYSGFVSLVSIVSIGHLILAVTTGILNDRIPMASSSWMLAFLLHDGLVPQMTYYRDIPMFYFVIALAVQNLLFLGAALAGYQEGLKSAPTDGSAPASPQPDPTSGRWQR